MSKIDADDIIVGGCALTGFIVAGCFVTILVCATIKIVMSVFT